MLVTLAHVSGFFLGIAVAVVGLGLYNHGGAAIFVGTVVGVFGLLAFEASTTDNEAVDEEDEDAN